MLYGGLLLGCLLTQVAPPDFSGMSSQRLMQDTKVLASDRFEGRAPCSPGEELTVAYLTKKLKEAGVQPGNPNGTFIQNVPLVGFKSTPSLKFSVSGKEIPLRFPSEFIHELPQLSSRASEKGMGVAFVGYGIRAKEYGWDDVKGADLKGKLVFVLGGEPSRPDPNNPDSLDERFFKGQQRTLYSTKDYKSEHLRKLGARAVFFLSNPDSSKSYRLFQTFAVMEGFDLDSKAAPGNQLLTTGVFHYNAAVRLFRQAGFDLAELKKLANSPSFAPVALDATADLTMNTKLRKAVTRNVVGIVKGSDPKLRNEYVVFSAHWDHLGRDTSRKGDQIYNGALDNAVGTSQLLEIARGFAKLKVKPKRSIIFLATAAEEKGWLGARHYLRQPLYPLASHVANINLDAGNPWGRTSDLLATGNGLSTMDDFLESAATMLGRKLVRENFDDNTLYFSSDQIEFARAGIPAAFPFSGFLYVGKPKSFGEEKWGTYGEHHYHRVSDEVRPDWTMVGAAEDCRFYATAGYLIANSKERPKWLPNAGFGNQPLISVSGR